MHKAFPVAFARTKLNEIHVDVIEARVRRFEITELYCGGVFLIAFLGAV